MADTVLTAVERLDVTVLYASTVRPFDAVALRAAVTGQDRPAVVLVEPYLAGTSVPEVAKALSDVPHRVLGLGVGSDELRHYGTARQHAIAHGLGSAGLRQTITSFLKP
jgi:transketolase